MRSSHSVLQEKEMLFWWKRRREKGRRGRMETQSDLANPYLQDDKDEPRRKANLAGEPYIDP